jgi:1,4-alpha-glucan branching enzyme
VLAPDARRVEIAGDFTDWQPVPMERVPAGRWRFDVRLAPGVHQLNVRVDGGAWEVPAGLASLRDEFSGGVGLLVVP